MKRKISISVLAFLFFASTTGLPIVLHYCEMMSIVSFELCEMHKMKTTSCCEEESSAKVFFTNGYDSCCSTKLVDKVVKDNFVISKTELISKIQLPIILFVSSGSDLSASLSNDFYNDTSPPPLADNLIYLNNSILLI